MDRRSRALESSGDQPEASTPKTTPKKVHQEAYSSTVEHSTSCQMKECNGSHSISHCNRYKQLGTRERKTVVRKLKLCMNCLRRHFVADCPSKFSCRSCNGRHHTSLHFDRAVEQQSGVTSGAPFSGPSVLLSTAIVGIDDTAGRTLMFRALLDCGSQTSLITADAASTFKINLARSTVDMKISGIGGRQQAAKESVSFLVGPQKLPITALVLNSIAGNIPSQSINLKQLKSMKGVALADKNFHQPGPVQLLLTRMCTRNSFWTRGRRIMGFTIASLSLAEWSLECCPKCVPTNVNPFKLQWNWTLLASGKLKRFLEWSRCLKKIVNVRNITIPRPMWHMTAASQFVSLSSLRHVPQTIFNSKAEIVRFGAKAQGSR